MKTKIYVFTLFTVVLITCVFLQTANAQNIFPATGSAGIGTTLPAASSALEIKSTTQGFLISRMTKVQRDAISVPATGLMIYQTNSTPGFYYYTGSVWKAVTPGSTDWSLKGNAGTNPATNFLGTTDAEPLVFKVNSQKSGYIDYDSLRGNSGFGYQSLNVNSSGNYNTAAGSQALLSNNTGFFNTAIGAHALYHTTIGYANTATGTSALAYNTSGSFNTAVGVDASIRNITGYSNVAIGMCALDTDVSGHNLVAVGDSALFNQNGGVGGNTAIGSKALYSNTTGGSNTANGYHALYSNSLGGSNTATGYGALSSNTTGSFNTGVGVLAYPVDGTVSNYTGIGYFVGTSASTSNMVEIGNNNVTVIRGEVNFSTYSDQRIKNNIKENVPGLAFINLLKPVTYNIDVAKQEAITYDSKKNKDGAARDYPGRLDIEKHLMTGFVAQAVDAAAQKVGYDFSGIVKPQNQHDLYSLRYADFVVPLVKAVQELSGQNDSLKNANNQMQSQLDALIKRMDALESAQQQCCSKSAANQQSAISNQQAAIGSNDVASLQQNAPNPFNGSCTISYYIPGNSHNAQLLITDVNGRTLKTYSLTTSGYGKQIINDSQLRQGEYAYSLWVDGKLIDTKKMELLK